jgi:hypothetical protein
LVGRRCPGCIAPRSCIFVVDLPLVEVDSPEDFEVVISSEIPRSFVFRLWIYKIQLLSLLCFASP